MTDLADATRTSSPPLTSVQEALSVAAELSKSFAEGAGARDAHRILPHEQVQALKASGLLALSVPAEHGGLDVPMVVLAEVIRLLAHGDPSIGQIPHSHFTFLEALRLQGSPPQQAFFYGLVRDGALFANAQSERGPHPIDVDTTTLTATATATATATGYVLDGRKFYSTGALFADWLIVRASHSDGSGQVPTATTPKGIAFVPRNATGVEIVDDWDGMGQRTTASGTVTLEAVEVPAAHVLEFSPIFTRPTVYGARAQLLHAALDVGIATAALEEAVRQAARARPHFEAAVSSAVEDPTLVQVAGELTVTVRGAAALLTEAARSVDAARADLTEDSAAAASISVAVAKVAAARAAVDAGSALFEFGGTRSASASGNLSRYWRDARTHTLHDPTRWKIRHIGNYTLAGTKPPRHGQL
ncbi:SfnB family sulfur acquisition oxidoreductase [Mycobacterium sp. GA-1841]|uniref:SfnB family sulfur acquisition oxidoreductase n=1 Tax=Mycobacterium sp. GA-1841 TaxID=1834154 RepID=UPI00096D510C|nr:SfnB family sulfur acquisition oxidoreductase [Mycobacterium sp. GA-1841]OMC35510.1 SfnB family sulfur acquisition oxidoreductase [Mycobacterium sp. GA-1841]